MHRSDVLIVGAGMAGAKAAPELQQSGLILLFVEKGCGESLSLASCLVWIGQTSTTRYGSWKFDTPVVYSKKVQNCKPSSFWALFL